MIKMIKKQMKNEKGLTLIELLAVIVILGIIIAIAIPAIGNIITNSKYNAVKADAVNVLNAAQLYYVDNPEESSDVSVGTLKSENYLESAGNFDKDAAGTAHLTETIIGAKSPHTLTVTVTYANGKKVTFNGATITDINGDTAKGSSDGDKTIPN